MRSLRNFFALFLIMYLGLLLFSSTPVTPLVSLAFLSFSIMGLIVTSFIIWVRSEGKKPAQGEQERADRDENGKGEQGQGEETRKLLS
jgi:hypothetical protein